ncbi:MAG: hypothetical protein WD716_05595 [Fimbriimonadaceae bacterium]
MVGSALAQVNVGSHRSVEFARGEGLLTARDDAQARFQFRVRQEGENPAEGALKFTAAGPHGSTLTIYTERLPRLQVRGEHASFGGPAVLEVSRTPNSEGFRWEGQVVVTIRNDVRIGDGRDARIVDVMEIAFTTERTDRRYDFAGVTPPRNIEIGVRIGS